MGYVLRRMKKSTIIEFFLCTVQRTQRHGKEEPCPWTGTSIIGRVARHILRKLYTRQTVGKKREDGEFYLRWCWRVLHCPDTSESTNLKKERTLFCLTVRGLHPVWLFCCLAREARQNIMAVRMCTGHCRPESDQKAWNTWGTRDTINPSKAHFQGTTSQQGFIF